MWYQLIQFMDKLYQDGKSVEKVDVKGNILQFKVVNENEIWVELRS